MSVRPPFEFKSHPACGSLVRRTGDVVVIAAMDTYTCQILQVIATSGTRVIVTPGGGVREWAAADPIPTRLDDQARAFAVWAEQILARNG